MQLIASYIELIFVYNLTKTFLRAYDFFYQSSKIVWIKIFFHGFSDSFQNISNFPDFFWHSNKFPDSPWLSWPSGNPVFAYCCQIRLSSKEMGNTEMPKYSQI